MTKATYESVYWGLAYSFRRLIHDHRGREAGRQGGKQGGRQGGVQGGREGGSKADMVLEQQLRACNVTRSIKERESSRCGLLKPQSSPLVIHLFQEGHTF